MELKIKNLPYLTGLRGLAAYLVLFAHTLSFSGVGSVITTSLAYFGMSLFFVLSGFVIQYNYGESFARGIRLASLSFLRARFARLYPLYFMGLILSCGLSFPTPFIAIACLTLTQTWFNVEGGTGDLIKSSWSISSEFLFYLLYIPFAGIISRLINPCRYLVLLCLISPIGIYSTFYLIPDTRYINEAISAPLQYWYLYYSPLTRAFEFFTGALTAKVFLTYAERGGIKLKLASFIIGCCVAYCIFMILIGSSLSIDIIQKLLPNFIFAPAIAVALVFLSEPNTIWCRMASSRLAMGAGEISYSVYLLENLVFIAMVHSFPEKDSVSLIMRCVYTFALATALGYGVHQLFEAPMRRWIRRGSYTKNI